MTKNNLSKDLIELLLHCRDLSVRDGQQSLDGNKMRIEDIVPVLKELNEFYVQARDEYGLEIPPTEVWGGGTVKQPINFNGEDALNNLKQMREAAPDLILQDLYRGRQGYGFKPTSREVQFAATERAYELGIRSHRVFDMMNDMDNLRNGIEAAQEMNSRNPNDKMNVEGAISYISEPDGEKVWSPDDYADFSVDLVAEGCDDIVLKDYAGLLMDENETKSIIQTISQKLKETFPDKSPPVRVSLHSHGHKPEILSAALESGAQFVDTAIGDLAKGTSHTNMRKFIESEMEAKGHSLDDINAHPLMQKLSKVEQAVELNTLRHKPYRIPADKAPKPKQVARYRFAGGAYASHFNFCLRMARTEDVNDPKAQALYNSSLEVMPALWEAAGRFNTVTPGALILSREAIAWASLGDNAEKILALVASKGGAPLAVADLDKLIQPKLQTRTQAYKDVVMGRYGRNRGMDKGIGDTRTLALFLLEDGLKQVFAADNPLQLNGRAIAEGLKALGFEGRTKVTERTRSNILRRLSEEPNIEALRQRLISVVKKSSNLDDEQKKNILGHFDVARFPDPETGLELADNLIKYANDNGIDLDKIYEKGESDLRLIAALTSDGVGTDMAKHLTEYLFSGKQKIPVVSAIEPQRSLAKAALQSIEPKIRQLLNIDKLKVRYLQIEGSENRYHKVCEQGYKIQETVSNYLDKMGVNTESPEYKNALKQIKEDIEASPSKPATMQERLIERSAANQIIDRVR